MSKKINTTSIGLFIVTGVALGVIGLLLFSSSKLFTKTVDCVIYFDQSLNGLNVGAPVKYRGVTIGSVKRVMVRSNQATNDYAMPVIIELDEKLINERLGEPLTAFTGTWLEERVANGMRATLQAESLVTGILYVEMRRNPKSPTPVFHQVEQRYPEIPSEPTQIQALLDNLASLDIKGISTNLNALITRLDTTVGQFKMADINAGLTNLLVSMNRLVTDPDLTNALATLRPTLDQYRLLGEKLNGRIDPLADSVTNTLAEADRALAQFRGAAQNLRTLIAPDAPLPNNLDQTLRQLSGAVQSLSVLLDFLKQHPNALITGRETIREKLEK